MQSIIITAPYSNVYYILNLSIIPANIILISNIFYINVLCVIQKENVSFWIIANIYESEVKKGTFLTALYSYVILILIED